MDSVSSFPIFIPLHFCVLLHRLEILRQNKIEVVLDASLRELYLIVYHQISYLFSVSVIYLHVVKEILIAIASLQRDLGHCCYLICFSTSNMFCLFSSVNVVNCINKLSDTFIK